jgi:hypothetical protein
LKKVIHPSVVKPKEKKPTGRPRVEGDKRTRLVAFYLTEDDAQFFRNVQKEGGFKSTSHVFTALLEPIAQGRLSLQSFVRSCRRFQRFAESNGLKFTAFFGDLAQVAFRFGTPPPPPIPDDETDLPQLRADLMGMLDQLEAQQTETNQTK